MKLALTTIVAAALLTGCSEPQKAESVLRASGYTDIQIEGYSFFGCSKDDVFKTAFKAKGPTGVPVSGVVCSGLFFKGSTVRLD